MKVINKGAWQLIRLAVSISSRLMPVATGKAAANRFLTPPRHYPPLHEIASLNQARLEQVNLVYESLPVYRWGHQGPVILLVHGWGGRAGQMFPFVQPLLERGFQVAAFDGPAHGVSQRRQTNMIEFADAIITVSQQIGQIHGIIGHSFGAACSALAVQYGLNSGHLVLIGCPRDALSVTRQFAGMVGLNEQAFQQMLLAIKAQFDHRWQWEEFTVSRLLGESDTRVSLIHDLLDKEIPHDDAMTMINQMPEVQLLTTHGWGHRRILQSDEVISYATDFLAFDLPSSLTAAHDVA